MQPDTLASPQSSPTPSGSDVRDQAGPVLRPPDAFAPGLNNDYDHKPKLFLCWYPPGPPLEPVILGTHQTCKNPACDRFACTASAPGYSQFCCPACAQGKPHTGNCDTYIVQMRRRLVNVRSLMAGLYPDGVIIYPDGTVAAYEPVHVERTPDASSTTQPEAKP